LSSNEEWLPAGVDEDDLDAMEELLVAVQMTINGCADNVLPLTDFPKGYFSGARNEVNRVENTSYRE
jgi:hypothetical protein